MSGMLFLPREQNNREWRGAVAPLQMDYERMKFELEQWYVFSVENLAMDYHRRRGDVEAVHQIRMEEAHTSFWEVAHD